jgi:hypothetical protein
MSVSARFYVAEVIHRAHAPEQAHVKLQASTRGDENKAWAAATPFGQLEMAINNPSAAAWFTSRLGQDVALTFSELEPARYSTPYEQPLS